MSAKRKSSVRTSPSVDEVPELDRDWIEGADYFEGTRLVRRGRPKLEKPKRLLSLRLPPDVIANWKASGPVDHPCGRARSSSSDAPLSGAGG